jgi:hypothetical protein
MYDFMETRRCWNVGKALDPLSGELAFKEALDLSQDRRRDDDDFFIYVEKIQFLKRQDLWNCVYNIQLHIV